MSAKKRQAPADVLASLYAGWWHRFEQSNGDARGRWRRMLQIGDWAFGAQRFAALMEAAMKTDGSFEVYQRWEELDRACLDQLKAEMGGVL